MEASQLDLIIQTAPDAIISIDAEGLIRSFSPAAEKMFGYSEREVLGQNVKILMPEPYRSEHDGYMERYLATGEKRIIGIGREVRALRKNGEIFAAELAVGELADNGASIFTGFIRDVTDRVEAVRRAGRLQHALDQVSRIRTLGEMSTALAHEINQPLTAISNFAKAAERVLSDDQPDVEKASHLLADVAIEARRAGEIIKRMRSLVDRGRAEPRAEDINDIVQEAVKLTRSTAARDDLHVDCHLAQGLPRVKADRIQIQQVIVNLMRNAVEALTGEDRIDVHISTALEATSGSVIISAVTHEDGRVRVTVSDTGPGIPETMLEDVFEPFTTGKASGLGVGLAICRSIIDAHGGRIWAENNSHGGADVHFTLPVAEDG